MFRNRRDYAVCVLQCSAIWRLGTLARAIRRSMNLSNRDLSGAAGYGSAMAACGLPGAISAPPWLPGQALSGY